MPSTYTVNLGIEKPATGEQSGTWGDTVNENSNILDEAINGIVSITLASAGSSGSPNQIAITNGSSSTGRNKWIEFADGGDLGASAYVELIPNDAEKICFIRNSLSASQSVFLFQGTYSASNDLEIAAGTDVVVKFSGTGTGSTVVNINANLKVDGIVATTADINGGTIDATVIGGSTAAAVTGTTVAANTSVNIAGDGATVTGIKDEDNMASNSAVKLATQQSIKAYVDAQVATVDTLSEVLAIGNTSGSTDINMDAAQKVQFRDAAIYLNSSVDGQLDIVADTEIQIAATTIDINGAVNASGEIIAASLDISGNVDVTGNLGVDGITNLDVVDIDGAVQADAAITVGIDGTGHDVKFFGDTPGNYMLWDQSADDLILAGTSSVSVGGNLDVDGTIEFDALSGTGAVAVTDIKDEDDMSSNSATMLATQQSIKAYVDAQVDTVDTLSEVLAIGNTSGSTDVNMDAAQKVQFRDAAIYINSSVDGQLDIVADTEIQIAATTIDINGAINASGEIIAASLDISGNVDVDGTIEFDALSGTGAVAVTDIKDEDDMASNSATMLATQQSIKAYVDAQVDTVDTLSEVLAIGNTSGSTDINMDAAQKVQFRDAAIYINSSVDGQLDIVADTEIQIAATTIDINGAINASGEIIAASLDISGNVDVDGTIEFDALSGTGAVAVTDIKDEDDMASNSATMLATQQSIKAYVDAAGTDALSAVLAVGNTTGGTDLTISIGDDLTTLTAGTGNFRAGAGAGASIASGGNDNTLVGTSAGAAITTGDNNTAVGDGALLVSTTASHNSAFGRVALNKNTTGGWNTAIGFGALHYNTTGVENTSIGFQSLFTNTTGNYNTASGFEALFSNTTGADNTASGYEALRANTTASNNSAFGYSSLTANTTGHSNTASGYQALKANTTGANNAALGLSALYTNTTGSQNVAIGTSSLLSNTTGNANTAVGYSALNTNAVGIRNTAMGYDSLLSNTGSYNTAYGMNSLKANTSGLYNTAMGYNALLSNTTGIDNTAVGMNAMDVSVSGSYNTTVGHDSLGALTTGGFNTVVGRAAGWTITTGAQNTIIGYNADVPTAGTSNAVIIGMSVVGTGSYTTLGNGTSDIRAAHGVATWATVSDERYKKGITDSTAGLAFVNALKPRTWNYKTLGELPETFSAYEEGSTEVFKNTQTNHGFIAQEVKAAIDADSGLKDGFRMWDDRDDGSQEVAEAALIPVLVKAIQELTARLAILEDK